MRKESDDTNRLLDEYDDLELSETLELLGLMRSRRASVTPRLIRSANVSRWRSVEEYREWKELVRQIDEVFELEKPSTRCSELDKIH
jgi:hypothetical protein